MALVTSYRYALDVRTSLADDGRGNALMGGVSASHRSAIAVRPIGHRRFETVRVRFAVETLAANFVPAARMDDLAVVLVVFRRVRFECVLKNIWN